MRRRGAAKWCVDNGVKPGEWLEMVTLGGEWIPVRVTAIGESAVVLRREGCDEFLRYESARLRVKEG